MSVMPSGQSYTGGGGRPDNDIIEDPYEYSNDDEHEFNHTRPKNDQKADSLEEEKLPEHNELNDLELSHRDVNIKNYWEQD